VNYGKSAALAYGSCVGQTTHTPRAQHARAPTAILQHQALHYIRDVTLGEDASQILAEIVCFCPGVFQLVGVGRGCHYAP